MNGSRTSGKFIRNEASNDSIVVDFGCEVIGSLLSIGPILINFDTREV